MPDEEGYLLPGELGGGGYGALEGDLGHRLRPLAGFGRDLTPFEPQVDGFWEEEESEVQSNGFGTGGFRANYVLRGWNG